MSDLSADQAEKLAIFKEITSFEDQDYDKIIKLLRTHQWNLEIAIPRFFDGNFEEEPLIPPHQTQAGSTGVEPFTNIDGLHTRRPPLIPSPLHRLNSPMFDLQDTVPKFPKAILISENWKFKLGLPPKEQVNQGAISPIIFIFLLIPRTILIILSGLANLIDFFFPGFNRLLGLVNDPSSFPLENLYNELQPDFQDFFDDLTGYEKESETSNARRLIFHVSEYNNAYNFAKSNLKWLMVVLVNNETKDGLKTLAKNDVFRKFCDKNDLILWGGNVDYIEPFEVGKLYKVRKLPQLILISNVSKMGEFPLMSVVNRVTVPTHCTKDMVSLLFKKLQKSIDIYEPQLISQRYDKHELEVSRLIRREQDDAYNKSLLADKRKMDAKLLQKRQEEEAMMKEKMKEEEKMKKIKLRESYLIIKSIELLESNENFEKGNHTRIQFRLGTGERTVQNFLSTKSLYDLFLFVDCKMFLKTFEEIEDEEELLQLLRMEKLQDVVDINDYNHEFNFDLIQPIPRFVLKPQKDVLVGDVKEIWPNGNLLVEYDVDEDEVEEEDDDDDEDEDEKSDEGNLT